MEKILEFLKRHIAECPPHFGNGESILGLLYEAYTELNNLDNAQIKADFHALYQAMNGKDLREMDQILDPVCALCRDHERAGFIGGIKVGIQLANELI